MSIPVVSLAFAAGSLGAAGFALLAGPPAARLAARARAAPRAGGLMRVLAAIGARLRLGPDAGGLEQRVAAAGSPGGLGPRELMAAKLAAAALGGGAGALLAGSAPGRLGPLIAAAAPVGGFLAPDLWLARRAAARARRVARELPGLLDLLRVTLEAGASLPSALAQVGSRTGGALAAGWRTVAREVELGIPLRTALARLERRFPQPEVRAFVAALGRAERHGAPLADTLAAQARDARLALGRRLTEEAARAGPQIQLVVALLLVPSVLLLVAAALISELVLGPQSSVLGP